MPENEPHPLPPSLRVLGKPFFLIEKDELIDKNLGYTQTHLGLVHILRSLRYVEKQDAVIHELTHVISDLLGLRLTEKQVHGLAAGWHAVLSDNPELHQFLTPVTLPKLEP